MRPFFDFLRRHFLMSRRELYGMVVLTALLGLWLGSSRMAAYFFNQTTPPLEPPLLDSLATQLPPTGSSYRSKKYNKKKQGTTPVQQLFAFDPNTATLADWQRLGAPQWLARRIINYRNKGGRFRQPEDLQKIYGFPPALYETLAPYVKINDALPEYQREGVINEEPSPQEKEAGSKQSSAHLVVELNSADTTTLKRLRGIGSVYARRIVRYRASLGGFYSVEQLKEVYGLPEETFQRILPFITIDTARLRLIRINEVDAETLARHPYLNKRKASAIVAYRLQHGKFQSVGDLKKIKVLHEEEIERLAPYLAF